MSHAPHVWREPRTCHTWTHLLFPMSHVSFTLTFLTAPKFEQTPFTILKQLNTDSCYAQTFQHLVSEIIWCPSVQDVFYWAEIHVSSRKSGIRPCHSASNNLYDHVKGMLIDYTTAYSKSGRRTLHQNQLSKFSNCSDG